MRVNIRSTLDTGAFSLTQWHSNYCDVNPSHDGCSRAEHRTDTECEICYLRRRNFLSDKNLSFPVSTGTDCKWRCGLHNSPDGTECVYLIPILCQANRQDWSLSRSTLRDDGTVACRIECNSSTRDCCYRNKMVLTVYCMYNI